MRLADHGVGGNGRGTILESNSDGALAAIERWVSQRLG